MSAKSKKQSKQKAATYTGPILALKRKPAAQAIGVSPATLDRLVERKLINPSRGTKRPVYAVAELERYLRVTAERITA